MEARADFLAAGGSAFHYIPCLNENPQWIEAMSAVVEQHLGGWPTASLPSVQEARKADAEIGRQWALTLGAEN